MRQIRREVNAEYQMILAEVHQANRDLQLVYNQLSYVTEPEMIDATIHQLNAVQKRYEYLVGIAKQKQTARNKNK